jgi:ribosomal protein S19
MRRQRDRRPFGRGYHKLFGASVVTNLGDGMGTIAYPWLASAVTRNPLLISLVFVAQRLPWLVFTLPAGVITDRVDRRRAMVAMDACRAVLTLLVAFAVLGRQGQLPSPDEVDAVIGTDAVLYGVVVAATLLLGMAEVLRDNSAQTILPALVPADRLEAANGRMWSAESVTNTFLGPPLGSLLLTIAFSLPFFVDAATFAVAAVLVGSIRGDFRAEGHDTEARRPWRQDLAEGVRWLWGHELLRPMAIILGVMNAAGMIAFATLVLFAQEVLGVGPLLFTVVSAAIGLSSHWLPVLALFAVTAMLGIIWNVITVSLRQAIIPPRMLGRVNSVYRFFAWGMMPIGAAIGGVVVVVVDGFASRELALRATWFVSAAIHVVLYLAGRHTLTTERITAARTAATGVTPPVDPPVVDAIP